MSRSYSVAEFEARCLAVVDAVERSGAAVTITRDGRPIARLVAVDDHPEPLFGRLKGWLTREGDLLSPVDDAWEADGG